MSVLDRTKVDLATKRIDMLQTFAMQFWNNLIQRK
jgi:hypothetical protein